VWAGVGPAQSHARIRYELTADGDGATQLEYVNEFTPPGGRLGTVAGRVIVIKTIWTHRTWRQSTRSSQMVATVKRSAELLVDRLRSRTKRAPFATSIQGQVLIKGVDIDQTLVIAEQELKRGRIAAVLTLWGIRDLVYTEAQAQRVSFLYFQYIDARKDYFDVWHFTWAISNIYRNGDAAVRAELELAYQDAKKRAKAAGGWADGLANRNILMGDIHPPARHFVQTHVVAPGSRPGASQPTSPASTSRNPPLSAEPRADRLDRT